jgi:hypothetical protein
MVYDVEFKFKGKFKEKDDLNWATLVAYKFKNMGNHLVLIPGPVDEEATARYRQYIEQLIAEIGADRKAA